MLSGADILVQAEYVLPAEYTGSKLLCAVSMCEAAPQVLCLRRMCGMHDIIHALYRHVDAHSGSLTQRKKLSLGTQPIIMRKLHACGTAHVFAASDRPTIIHSANKKLLYSNLNETNVSGLAQNLNLSA